MTTLIGNIVNSIINVNADKDNVVIHGYLEDSAVYGGVQSDTIRVNNTINSLVRGDLDDDKITINGDLIGSVVNGNAGDDSLTVTSAVIESSTIYGGQGNDRFSIIGNAIYIDGGKGNDAINTNGNEEHTIYGGLGEDTIISNSSKKTLIYGGSDKDSIVLNSAASNNASHTVDGGAGADSLRGTIGNDLLDGGGEDKGNDTIISKGGHDTIYGRGGIDIIDLETNSINDGNVLVQAGSDDDIIKLDLSMLTYMDTIKGEKGNDTLALIGTAIDFNMWEDNTTPQKAFDSIDTIEILSFGTSTELYQASGTKTINLARKVESAGISKINASNVTSTGSATLVINAFQFSARTNLTLIGSDDKDVNVHFTGGSRPCTLTTGKITKDGSDTPTGGLGVDTFNVVCH